MRGARSRATPRRELEPIDFSAYRRPPRGRVAVGLVLLTLAPLLGVPFAALAGGVAAWFGAPRLGVIAAGVAWALSFPVFALGLVLGGAGARSYAEPIGRLVGRTLRRVWGRRRSRGGTQPRG